MLDDFASMARAALALFEATGERHYLDAAREADAGGAGTVRRFRRQFFLTARDADDVPGARPRHPHDGATPVGRRLDGREFWRGWPPNRPRHLAQRGRAALIRAFSGAPNRLAQSPFLLAAADFLERGACRHCRPLRRSRREAILAAGRSRSPDPATCVLRTAERRGPAGEFAGHGKKGVE